MKIAFAIMDIWKIVNKSEKSSPSNADPKVLKLYQRCVNKVMSIIGLNLVDNQFVHSRVAKDTKM